VLDWVRRPRGAKTAIAAPVKSARSATEDASQKEGVGEVQAG
jgi:hypothetical protein